MSVGDLQAKLEGVEALSLEGLRQAWPRELGGPPPKLRTRDLLALALAYRLQARMLGDLPGPMKRRVSTLARRFAEDRGYTPAPGSNLKAGCSLVKEWRGARHEVRVLEAGYSYQGERFGSLSEVANRITGTKWNGPVFFGLRERRR